MTDKQQPIEDPYPTYTDGNCRDISGQIIPCGSPFVVSPAKWPKPDDEEDTDAEE